MELPIVRPSSRQGNRPMSCYFSPIPKGAGITCTMCEAPADHYDDDSQPYCADKTHNSITVTGIWDSNPNQEEQDQ